MLPKGVVRSILRTNFKDAIEDIVQLRSRVQALGNLVFNKAVLLACASGSLPEQITSQAFIAACQRAVCVRNEERYPSIIKFKHVDCLPFLEQAQHYVIQKLNTFDNNSQLTETFNQAAREYVTVLTNGVWMNFVKWQRKLIRVLLEQSHLTKSSMRFVVDRILQIINRAPNGPNPNNYKCESVRELGVPFIEGEKAKEIIDTFVEWMAPIPNKPMKKSQIDWLGIANQTHIESNLSKFLYTGLKIVSKLEEIRDGMGDEQKKPRIPQIIPQLTYKIRCVTFGVEQTRELSQLCSLRVCTL